MSLEEFAAKIQQLQDPYTDPQTRQTADQWLTHLRDSFQGWTIAQAALSSGPSFANYGSQMLSYKCKRQLDQIQSIEDRAALLQSIMSVLSSTSTAVGAISKSLCVAASNLMIQLLDLHNPLATISSLLDQKIMLEFLTVLPGECEDRQLVLIKSGSDIQTEETILHLKKRSETWCIEAGAWLHSVLLQTSNVEESYVSTVAAIVNCFAAWIKFGGLFHMQRQHWEPLLRSAAGLLLLDPEQLPIENSAGIEAFLEAIERPCDGISEVLFDILAPITGHISQCIQTNAKFGQLHHIFATFCSTNATLVASRGPHGETLRRGLLELVALSPYLVKEEAGLQIGDVPVLSALGDVLDEIVSTRYNGDDEENSHRLREQEALQFASMALNVLLDLAKLPGECFITQSIIIDNELPAVNRILRAAVAWPVHACAQISGAEGFAGYLYSNMYMGSVNRHGGGGAAASVEAIQALDACYYALKSASEVFENEENWLPCVLLLYAAAATAVQQQAMAMLTFFHYDLLVSFAELQRAWNNSSLVRSAAPDQICGLLELIFNLAAAAASADASSISSHFPKEKENNIEEEEDRYDILEASSAAVLCILGGPFSIQALSRHPCLPVIDSMLSSLEVRNQHGYHVLESERASGYLMSALVHAVHAEDVQNASTALTTLNTRALRPLLITNSNPNALHTSLKNVQAVLNALESHADEVETIARPVAAATAAETVSACMGAWNTIISSAAASAANNNEVAAISLFEDASQCMCSCVTISPHTIEPFLQPLLDSICPVFYLHGGHALHKIICSIIQTFGAKPEHQGPILTAVLFLLNNEEAKGFYNLRGGDADPDLSSSLLTVALCLLRDCCSSWQQISVDISEIFAKSIYLGAANTACNHKTTILYSISLLTAAAVLALDPTKGSYLLKSSIYENKQGSTLVLGLILCLISLHSATMLPRIVALMLDTATMAVIISGGSKEDAMRVLNEWFHGSVGILASQMPPLVDTQVVNKLEGNWNWSAVVDVALAVVQNEEEIKKKPSAVAMRGTLREVRQLIQLLKT